MKKINSVYAVENKIGGGMKNIEKSKKEVNALHGEVSVYELNKPQPYEVFSSWPEDIQKENLKKLYWTHGASFAKIGLLFGFSDMWARNWFKKWAIPTRGSGGSVHDRNEQAKKWDAFLRGGTCIKDMIPEGTKQQLEEMARGICKKDSSSAGKQVSSVAPSPHIVEIRRKMMDVLDKMSNEEFAELADGIYRKELGTHFGGLFDAENTMCKTCRRLFGACRAELFNATCPFEFGKWLEVDDTDAGDFELLKWWAKEDTRRLMAEVLEG